MRFYERVCVLLSVWVSVSVCVLQCMCGRLCERVSVCEEIARVWARWCECVCDGARVWAPTCQCVSGLLYVCGYLCGRACDIVYV